MDNVTLLSGNHAQRDQGVCVMEAVAWFAGETHSDEERLAVLVEEVGEVARAILEYKRLANDVHGKNVEKELVQIAAVVVAWLESRP